jgi:pseudouridine synthase
LVKASTLLGDDQLDQLRRGVELDDGPTRPAIVSRVRDSASSTFFEITITEGRNRQVRRMVEFLGSEERSTKVRKLVRTQIGPIAIGDLQIGTYRELTEQELRQLSGNSKSKPSPRPDTTRPPTNVSTRSRRRP